jgi:glycosyltransferase involved in cell wall biosynthesis
VKPLQRIAFIGNYPPRRCGIATFTHDLHLAVEAARPELDSIVVALTDRGAAYDYSRAVGFQIRDDVVADYVAAAEFLNQRETDVVCLQHEYGIFGGEAGGHIVEFLSRLDMPIVTTLHTVLPGHTPVQRRVTRQIIDASTQIIVMAKKGRELLHFVLGVPDRKIEVIPHGIPDFPFIGSEHAKAKLGFVGKTIILTFGLLSPNKGIETMLDAMADVIEACPNAVYVILGATHPNLVRDHGETYRESLMTRVRVIGLEDHVVFFNQFVDQSTLLDFISMCDVYVTPYLNEAQMTSGTLAYSFGLGKAVVSTPYWHATDLLSEGRGSLVPFGDAKAMGAEIAGLLTDDRRCRSMRERAYASSRSMTWAQTGKRYLASFEAAARKTAAPDISRIEDRVAARSKGHAVPGIRIEHFLSMCDSTGMLQHAVHSVADRDHGYCVDDNARALIVAMALAGNNEALLPEPVTARFAAFIQHAWNPDNGRFRNFMSYDRRWLEPLGSEDSHGRTLWALAECSGKDSDPSRRQWAAVLFKAALPIVEHFSSPRAWAFTLLGLDVYCPLFPADPAADRIRRLLADRLLALLSEHGADDEWRWFEDVLAYDNARLPQALIQTGLTTATSQYVAAGLRSLRWLMALQTSPSGCFRPVGSMSFGKVRQKPNAFDQQPVEAAATISACLAAGRADDSAEWSAGAMRAFDWFLGENDLKATLVDVITGGCSDGLHPDRPNENKGAESALSFLLALLEVRRLQGVHATDRTKTASRVKSATAAHSTILRQNQGGRVVAIPIPEPPDIISTSGPSQGRRAALQAGHRAERP